MPDMEKMPEQIYADPRTGQWFAHSSGCNYVRADRAQAQAEPVAQLGGAPDDLRNMCAVLFDYLDIGQINEVTGKVLARRDPALASPPPALAVGVKPLEWRHFDNGNGYVNTPVGQSYAVYANGNWCLRNGSMRETDGGTLESAKAAAQADYERRILSALLLAVGNEPTKKADADLGDGAIAVSFDPDPQRHRDCVADADGQPVREEVVDPFEHDARVALDADAVPNNRVSRFGASQRAALSPSPAPADHFPDAGKMVLAPTGDSPAAKKMVEAIIDTVAVLFRAFVRGVASKDKRDGRMSEPIASRWVDDTVASFREDALQAALTAAAPYLGAGGGLSKAAADVLAERRRHVDGEGWTPEHDDLHSRGEMAQAAACYAMSHIAYSPDGYGQPKPNWPWEPSWWKPTDRRHDLVKAGSLIIAEIERLDRLPSAPEGGENA